MADLLKAINLENVPTLIIDDESDQASLNTKAARIKAGLAAINEMSTTYSKILKLRDALPHHSYLQYTATPQAILLLAQNDLLDPDFAELVTPGATYTGGKSFFLGAPELIVDIPTREVPSPTNSVLSPPKSLLQALRYFLLAAAQHSLTREKGMKGKDRNRSMMVHPAVATSSHKVYKSWVDKARKGLQSMVERLYLTDPKAAAEIFAAEYKSLQKTCAALRPLKELVSEMVEEVFDELNVVEVNGTPDAERKVNWKQTPYWILVGGAKLDRGYTVEGLCVTYMPRPLGTSPAADTLQQRARFFGYKSRYLGLCRVFVQRTVRTAFKEYVEHEEFVREALAKNRGRPLKNWKRDLILTAALTPTRANVIGLGVRRIPVNGWLVPQVLHRDDDAAEKNRKLLESVVRKWEKKSKRQNASAVMSRAKLSPHDVLEGIPLADVLTDFMLEVSVKEPHDSEEHNAMVIALAQLRAKHPSLEVDVFLMNKLGPGYRTRTAGRGVSDPKQRYAPINQYFSQSAGTLNDRDYCTKDRIALQLRRFNLGTIQRDERSADVFNVAWFALHVPELLRKDLLIEKRG